MSAEYSNDHSISECASWIKFGFEAFGLDNSKKRLINIPFTNSFKNEYFIFENTKSCSPESGIGVCLCATRG